MNWRIAAFKSVTLVKTPRYSARLSNCENQPSTAFSQDARVGVKCSLKRKNVGGLQCKGGNGTRHAWNHIGVRGTQYIVVRRKIN